MDSAQSKPCGVGPSDLTGQPAQHSVGVSALQDFRARLAEAPPELFDMTVPTKSCGTPACFCGWARAFYFKEDRYTAPCDVADCLGLTDGQAADLFLMSIRGTGPRERVFAIPDFWPSNATHEEGLRVLDHLINSGEVDWRVARDQSGDAVTDAAQVDGEGSREQSQ